MHRVDLSARLVTKRAAVTKRAGSASNGLLTIDKDFLSLLACIHLRPKGTKS